MKAYAQEFYSSKAWKECRRTYAASVGGLCEICYRSGRVTPGEIVHHKIHITPQNITNPEIVLSWDNLELVCRDCHAQVHGKKPRRFTVDAAGRVTAL